LPQKFSMCHFASTDKIIPVFTLLIKPTDALISSFTSITTLHVPGRLSAHHQEFLAVHRHWYILCRFDYRLLPGAGWNCRCTAKNSWWWAQRLPETCRIVIPIKLEFSASVGFIHKESVTTHGHTILRPIFTVKWVFWEWLQGFTLIDCSMINSRWVPVIQIWKLPSLIIGRAPDYRVEEGPRPVTYATDFKRETAAD